MDVGKKKIDRDNEPTPTPPIVISNNHWTIQFQWYSGSCE